MSEAKRVRLTRDDAIQALVWEIPIAFMAGDAPKCISMAGKIVDQYTRDLLPGIEDPAALMERHRALVEAVSDASRLLRDFDGLWSDPDLCDSELHDFMKHLSALAPPEEPEG